MDPKGASLSKGLPAPTGDPNLDANFQEILRQLGGVVEQTQVAGEIMADGWYRDDTPAGSAALFVRRLNTGATGTQFFPIFFDCYLSFVGIHAHDGPSNGGPSDGTLTGVIYKNNSNISIAAAPQIDSANHFDTWVNTDSGLYVFAPGDRVEFRITTSAGWTPATTKVLAILKFTLL